MEKYIPLQTLIKKAGYTILISDKVDLRAKKNPGTKIEIYNDKYTCQKDIFLKVYCHIMIL